MNAHPAFRLADHQQSVTAAPYDQFSDEYIAYADGDPRRLFDFGGRYAYADRRLWAAIRAKLVGRRATGARSIRMLDAGCGPGTWLRRAVTEAHALGFESIAAHGFDVSEAQIRKARMMSRELRAIPGVTLAFELGDTTAPLPHADASIDLGLCLYCVLNHVPAAAARPVVAELTRVVAGHFIATVRAAGSVPTIYVDGIEKARGFWQDHARDRCEIDLRDERHLSIASHLFTANELRATVAPSFAIEELRGLDMFHSRFAPDRRWNPASLEGSEQLYQELACLEETFATDPNFIDRANHLLLVGRGRRGGAAT